LGCHRRMVANERFLEELPEVIAQFPGLKVLEKDGYPILSGFIELIAEDGELQDQYEIEVHPVQDYPYSFPLVYEVGETLPRNIDWHIYPDGHFCLAVPLEERLACQAGIRLKAFIQNQVLGFLYSQTFRKQNGFFYKERAHGILGRLQYYREQLGISKLSSIRKVLSVLNSGKEGPPDGKCYCGSGKKFRKCHRRTWRTLIQHAGDLIQQDYQEINELIALLNRKAPSNT